MKLDCAYHLKRYNRLRAKYTVWETTWEEIAELCRPEKADFIVDRTPGTLDRYLHQYDTTAITSAQTLASRLHADLTSPALMWFTLRMRDAELNKDDSIREWLEDCQQRIFLALAQSNFNSSINELYLDMTTFGTACMQISRKVVDNSPYWPGLSFRTHHLGGVTIAESYDGIIDTVYREFKLTASQAKERWPKVEMPKVEHAITHDPDEEHVYIHACMPNPDAKDATARDALLAEERPFLSHYMSKDDGVMCEAGGSYEQEYVVPRWMKHAKDVWGTSPALTALPDIRVLNDVKRMELSAWAKIIDPPYVVGGDGILGDLDLRDAGLTHVQDVNQIKQLQQMTQWQPHQLLVREMQDKIAKLFFVPQLELPERPNATATEVQIRYELMQRFLAPQMGRMQPELLNPTIGRVFFMMLRDGQMAPPPQALIDLGDQADMDVEYIGPLARAQRMEEVTSIERFTTSMLMLSKETGDPSYVESIDALEVPDVIADRLGAPATVVRDRQQREAEAEKRKQQMQQAQQMAMAEQQANVAKTSAETGSIMGPPQEQQAEAA